MIATYMLLFPSIVPALAFGSGCTQAQSTAGLCPSASLTETEVVLGLNGGIPGSGDGTQGDDWAPDTGPVDPFADCIYTLNSRCLVPGPSRAVEAQPVTWADIAAFSPAHGTAGMEPNGWAVTGLDTNFYASSASHVQPGTLLGSAAAVRFTPVGFQWDYGDGSTADLATSGSTWAKLGVGEFGATPTSHVFASSGNYTVTLSVEFAAEYRVEGMPWTPITGTIRLQAAPLQVTVGTANTVLVNQDCALNPQGPGC